MPAAVNYEKSKSLYFRQIYSAFQMLIDIQSIDGGDERI